MKKCLTHGKQLNINFDNMKNDKSNLNILNLDKFNLMLSNMTNLKTQGMKSRQYNIKRTMTVKISKII